MKSVYLSDAVRRLFFSSPSADRGRAVIAVTRAAGGFDSRGCGKARKEGAGGVKGAREEVACGHGRGGS